MDAKYRDHVCVVCGSVLIARKAKKMSSTLTERFYDDGFHCPHCGLHYDKPPVSMWTAGNERKGGG